MSQSMQKMKTSVKDYINELGVCARRASALLARAETGAKNHALLAMAETLVERKEVLRRENKKDLQAGEKKGLAAAMLDRLELNEKRISDMAEGLRAIAALTDPVGEITDLRYRPSGIQVGYMRVPLGVVTIIYESRPNVTADAAGLCIKSGNAVILRGGSEAIHSNLAISECLQAGLQAAKLPADAVQMVSIADRDAVGELIKLDRYVDVIVPRGGKGLIERVASEATIPVLKHLDGICHVYIDDKADTEKAIDIAVNAKTQRYGVCNAMETLLVAAAVAPRVLPTLAERYHAAGVELRGCDKTCVLLKGVKPATEEDWRAEYLAPILSIRIVENLDEAIEHINKYGSQHTDAIVTEDVTHARRFLREVDSSSVMVNASTRFADGFEYGLGAEIGISTSKLHARGPVGLEGLTSRKFVVLGDGHIRE